jgi:DegV family protein with EDD domain
MIHIVSDSTAVLSPEFLRAHSNVHVVPLTICYEGEYRAESDVSVEQVIEYCEREKQNLTTSQPSTGDWLKAFSEIPAEDPILVLCITPAVSGTFGGAQLAARQSGRENIVVVNSRTTAIGMVQLIEDTLEWIDEGLPFEVIANNLQEAAFRMRTCVMLDTIEYLRRGGRIGRATGFIGSILKIKPIIYLTADDEVDALEKVRTQKKGFSVILDYLKENAPLKRIGIVHVVNEEGGRDFMEVVKAEFPDVPITLSTANSVLAAYLGPGLVGAIFERGK